MSRLFGGLVGNFGIMFPKKCKQGFRARYGGHLEGYTDRAATPTDLDDSPLPAPHRLFAGAGKTLAAKPNLMLPRKTQIP
jgi:hypothetical protein